MPRSKYWNRWDNGGSPVRKLILDELRRRGWSVYRLTKEMYWNGKVDFRTDIYMRNKRTWLYGWLFRGKNIRLNTAEKVLKFLGIKELKP